MWAVWVYGYGSEKAAFWKAFEEGDTEGIEQYLNRVLSNSISIFDTKAKKKRKAPITTCWSVFSREMRTGS